MLDPSLVGGVDWSSIFPIIHIYAVSSTILHLISTLQLPKTAFQESISQLEVDTPIIEKLINDVYVDFH